MTRYQEILAVQRPYDAGTDSSGKTVFAFNLIASATGPVTTWEADLVTLIQAASLGAPNVDLFIGSKRSSPADGEGPFTHIISTSGTDPVETHNGDLLESLSALIQVRGSSWSATKSRAESLYSKLGFIRNVDVP